MIERPATPFYQTTACSVEETRAVALYLKKCLLPGDVVFFIGDLGAGKTTMIKGLCSSYSILSDDVTSPTFTLFQEYKGQVPIYHFDLWRLEYPEEFFSLGFDEYIPSADGITLVEWPEKIIPFFSLDPWFVVIEHKTENEREISLYGQKALSRCKAI